MNSVSGPEYFLGNLTQAQLPAAAAANSGYTAFVTDLGEYGVLLRSNGTRWRPVNGRAVFAKLAGAVIGITATPVRVLRTLLPAGSPVAANDDLILELTGYKSGATDTGTLSIYIGPTGDSTDTVITGFNAYAALAASSRAGGFVYPLSIVSATSVRKVGNSATNGSAMGGATSGVQGNATTIPDLAAATYISVYVASGGATDTMAVASADISWKSA